MATDTTKFPLDFDALQKGQWLSPEEIGRIYSMQPNDPRLQLKVMVLFEAIERTSEERGAPLLCRCADNGLRIMTDPEAVQRTEERAIQHRRACRKELRRMNAIDRANLDDDSIAKLDHQTKRLAMDVVSFRKNKQLSLAKHERQTPALIGSNETEPAT